MLMRYLVPYFAVATIVEPAGPSALVRFPDWHLGEAGQLPQTTNRIVAFWTAKRERGIGSSLLLGGVGAGGVMAPALFAISMQRWGWQSSFFVSGILCHHRCLRVVYLFHRPPRRTSASQF